MVQVADRQFKARHVEIHGLAGYGPSQLVSRKGGAASEGLTSRMSVTGSASAPEAGRTKPAAKRTVSNFMPKLAIRE